MINVRISFIFVLVLLVIELGSAYVGYESKWNRNEIDSCVSINELNKLSVYVSFSNAESYLIKIDYYNNYTVEHRATELYYSGWKIVVYRNEEFCSFLKHGICHHNQWLADKPFVEDECTEMNNWSVR